MAIILQNGVADRDALITDVGPGVIARRGDQLTHDVLAFMAKRTAQRLVGSSSLHNQSPKYMERPPTGSDPVPVLRFSICNHYHPKPLIRQSGDDFLFR